MLQYLIPYLSEYKMTPLHHLQITVKKIIFFLFVLIQYFPSAFTNDTGTFVFHVSFLVTLFIEKPAVLQNRQYVN